MEEYNKNISQTTVQTFYSGNYAIGSPKLGKLVHKSTKHRMKEQRSLFMSA